MLGAGPPGHGAGVVGGTEVALASSGLFCAARLPGSVDELDVAAIAVAGLAPLVGGKGFSDGPAGIGSSLAGDSSIRLGGADFDGGKRFLPADPESLREALASMMSLRPAPDKFRRLFNARFFSSSYSDFAAGSQRQLLAAANSSRIRCQSATRAPGRIPRIFAIWAAAAAEITCGCDSKAAIRNSS